MTFQLLSELCELEEGQAIDAAYPLCESIETFLTALLKKAESRPDDFLKYINSEDLAAQLNGLMILGKKEHREVQDDFAKTEDIDGKKLSRQFYKFIQDVGEPHTDRVFKDGANANTLLNYIGKQHAHDNLAKIKDMIDKAKGGETSPGDSASAQKLLGLIKALKEYYDKATEILTAAFLDKQKINPSLDSELDKFTGSDNSFEF